MFTLPLLLSLTISAFAAPLPWKREVPQEHSHEATLRAVRTVLNLNNPDGIVDPVFGLLGNAAASQGLGNIADPDCLQQATADQAFTNAKAAGDVEGMTQALLFRALERNTGRVGQASVLCTSIQAVNPEIAAITQHQDPASPNAATINKGIALELARQIASIGGDPLDALAASTFAPGNVNDPTGRGNSCNDENDANGCIFTLNLVVPDATEAEILAAVGDVVVEEPEVEDPAVEDPAEETLVDCPPDVTVTVTAEPEPEATVIVEDPEDCPPPETVTVTVAPTPTATAVDCPPDVTVTVNVTA